MQELIVPYRILKSLLFKGYYVACRRCNYPLASVTCENCGVVACRP